MRTLEHPKKIRHFFKNVMVKLGKCNWELRLIPHSSEGYCWGDRKIIDIGTESMFLKQLILHEIAHIDTCRFCNQKHNPVFWKEFKDLMYRFLPKEVICESQLEHMGYSTRGYYRITYGR